MNISKTIALMEPLQNGIGATIPEEPLAHIISQTFGMLKMEWITYGLGLHLHCTPTVCKANGKTDVITTRLIIKDVP